MEWVDTLRVKSVRMLGEGRELILDLRGLFWETGKSAPAVDIGLDLAE